MFVAKNLPNTIYTERVFKTYNNYFLMLGDVERVRTFVMSYYIH